jgi:hypothetical protein
MVLPADEDEARSVTQLVGAAEQAYAGGEDERAVALLKEVAHRGCWTDVPTLLARSYGDMIG